MANHSRHYYGRYVSSPRYHTQRLEWPEQTAHIEAMDDASRLVRVFSEPVHISRKCDRIPQPWKHDSIHRQKLEALAIVIMNELSEKFPPKVLLRGQEEEIIHMRHSS